MIGVLSREGEVSLIFPELGADAQGMDGVEGGDRRCFGKRGALINVEP